MLRTASTSAQLGVPITANSAASSLRVVALPAPPAYLSLCPPRACP